MRRLTWICPRLAAQYAVLIVICFYIAASDGGSIRLTVSIIRVILGYAINISYTYKSAEGVVFIMLFVFFVV